MSVLRLIQEEAIKDRTGRVVVQLPVKVATFLLNEKREAIRAIEQRHRVGVLLIPNESLETPHFKLNRLRVDELSDDQLRSYTLAEDYEEQLKAKASPPAVRGTDEEPMVKGVGPSTPAPTPPAPVPKPEVDPSFFGWLWSSLFGQPPQQPRNEPPARTGPRPARPDRHRRDRTGRRPEAESVAEAPAAKPAAIPPVVPEPAAAAMTPPVEDFQPEPAPASKPAVVPVEDAGEAGATAETEEESPGPRGRRGRRGGRRRRRGEAPAASDAGPANLEPGEEIEEGPESSDQGWEPAETGELAAATPPIPPWDRPSRRHPGHNDGFAAVVRACPAR